MLSTVLAQDHFFSDFLSLHLTIKTHKVSMMMLMGVGSWICSSALAADLMTCWSSTLTEWRVASWVQLTEAHFSANVGEFRIDHV